MKYNMISPVLIGGFVEMDRVLLYLPSYWFEDQRVILEQEVCLKNPIKTISCPELRGSQPSKKKIFLGVINANHTFCGTPCTIHSTKPIIYYIEKDISEHCSYRL